MSGETLRYAPTRGHTFEVIGCGGDAAVRRVGFSALEEPNAAYLKPHNRDNWGA